MTGIDATPDVAIEIPVMSTRSDVSTAIFATRGCLTALMLLLSGAAATSALATGAGTTGPGIVLLDANFDDKVVGSELGTGGPTLGEPIARAAEVSAIVVDAPLPTRALAIRHDSICCSQSVSFELLGGVEVRSGEVSIFFVTHAPTLGNFNVFVRERGGASRTFANVLLRANGEVRLHNSGNSIPIGSYVPGDTLAFELIFDMDARTYDAILNGTTVVTDRAHGVADRGVGRIVVGADPAADNRFFFDELSVVLADPRVFGNGFETP